ncbi:MAG TPA: GatB/YqeY domain-containing protein [Candidatus Paceibacterota bacterium]
MKEKMKDAMRSKDAVRLSVIRGIIASFTNECVTLGKGPAGELTDEEALAIIRKESKKRKDSIEQFTKGGRNDLVENEQAELNILNEFLPTLMSAEQIKPIVENKIKELGLEQPALRQAQGKLMQAVMQELKGKADGMTVKQVVESLLA